MIKELMKTWPFWNFFFNLIAKYNWPNPNKINKRVMGRVIKLKTIH